MGVDSNFFNSYSVRPLNEGETLNSFNCGDAELDEFILSKASEYRKTLLAVSYVLEENGNPIAYFSLSNDNLSAEIFESKTNFNRQMRKRFSSIALIVLIHSYYSRGKKHKRLITLRLSAFLVPRPGIEPGWK